LRREVQERYPLRVKDGTSSLALGVWGTTLLLLLLFECRRRRSGARGWARRRISPSNEKEGSSVRHRRGEKYRRAFGIDEPQPFTAVAAVAQKFRELEPKFIERRAWKQAELDQWPFRGRQAENGHQRRPLHGEWKETQKSFPFFFFRFSKQILRDGRIAKKASTTSR
jgi:hypothetical protein